MTAIFHNPLASQYTVPQAARPDASVSAFHTSLEGYTPTDLLSLPDLARELRVGHVLVKNESVRLGLPAFKILGASWAACRVITRHLGLPLNHVGRSLADLSRAAKDRGITLLTATDGNHGRALARISSLLGVKCQVYVPKGLETSVVSLIADEGALVEEVDGDYDAAVLKAYEAANAVRNGILVQDTALEGYEEIPKWIVDGYSTMFVEIDEQIHTLTGGKDADIVMVPVGVGSLAQAAVTHFKRTGRTSQTQIITVEPDTAACLITALRNASASSTSAVTASVPGGTLTSPTIMTGLCCGTVSPLAWPLLRGGGDFATSVADIEAHQAVKDLQRVGIDAGPCGAAPLAALRRFASLRPGALRPDSVVLLLATEGPREYVPPLDATTTDPVVLTQILTRIDSSNPDLSKDAGAGEARIADYLHAWLAHHGFAVHRLEARPGRPSIIGVAKGSGAGRTLMFNGHVDTVTLAGYNGDPLSGEIIDGAVHGRGAFDMKAGVAASLVAAYRARETHDLKGDIVLALVADEENLSLGTQEVLAAGWRADGAVVSEPTDEALMLAHKGFVWAKVDIIGKAGHGSRPDLGVDAIAKAGHFLVALERYGDALMKSQLTCAVSHSLLGTGTVHAGLIKGGEEISSYPALCTVSVERRTVPGETPVTVEQQLRVILDGITRDVPDFQYALRIGESRSPYEVDADHAFVRLFSKHAEAVLGVPPRITGAPYWADSALLADAGIPVVLFGAQGRGMHSANESVDAASIKRVTQLLTKFATDFCGGTKN